MFHVVYEIENESKISSFTWISSSLNPVAENEERKKKTGIRDRNEIISDEKLKLQQ